MFKGKILLRINLNVGCWIGESIYIDLSFFRLRHINSGFLLNLVGVLASDL